jgi:hypothetical protein
MLDSPVLGRECGVWIRRAVAVLVAFGLLSSDAVRAADPEIDHLLQSPVGKDLAGAPNLRESPLCPPVW